MLRDAWAADPCGRADGGSVPPPGPTPGPCECWGRADPAAVLTPGPTPGASVSRLLAWRVPASPVPLSGQLSTVASNWVLSPVRRSPTRRNQTVAQHVVKEPRQQKQPFPDRGAEARGQGYSAEQVLGFAVWCKSLWHLLQNPLTSSRLGYTALARATQIPAVKH